MSSSSFGAQRCSAGSVASMASADARLRSFSRRGSSFLRAATGTLACHRFCAIDGNSLRGLLRGIRGHAEHLLLARAFSVPSRRP